MTGTTPAQQVCIYLTESDRAGGQPAATALLQLLRREGCAGVTVLRGVAGFTHGRIITGNLVDVPQALPLVIVWVDTPERVTRLLPRLARLAPDSLVTVADVQVVQYPRRALHDVPQGTAVRDVMTPASRVVAASLDAGLHELVVLLLRKGRHAVPVLDQDQHVVGIITNRDLTERAGLPLRLELLRALGNPDDPAVAIHLARLQGEGRTAASIMTPRPVTIGSAVAVTDAATLLLRRHLKRLPVVDSSGQLLGIVSRVDILRTATSAVRQEAAELPPLQPGGQLPRQIGAVMNRYVPTVRPDASLADVFDAVVATRLHRAVVVDESGQPIGIIVDTDLLPQITPSAHPSAMRRLMHRVLPATPEMEETWQRQSGQRAADVMRPRVAMLVVPISAPLTEVIDRSLARRSKLITIVDDAGRVVGMADRADLLAALAAAI
jgi:CBS domain-containing protein/PII-like signaling protein